MRDNNPDALQQTNKLIIWRPRSNETIELNKKRVPASNVSLSQTIEPL